MTRPRRWVLQPSGQDRFDVLRAGRQLRSGLSIEQALRFIRTNLLARDRVFQGEPDGYQREITRKL